MPSPAAWREVPCVECGEFVSGIDFGARCQLCFRRRKRRADRLSRRIGLGGAVLMTMWVFSRPAASSLGIRYGLLAVAVTYALLYFIAHRFAMEVLP